MASSMDGATGWRQFTRITIPLISPTILVASVMAIIAAADLRPALRHHRGGPATRPRTAVMVIYDLHSSSCDSAAPRRSASS